MDLIKFRIYNYLKINYQFFFSLLRKINLVPWTWFGFLSKNIAKQIETAEPTILIISLPRSGSSWVGEILGSAENALYLREPLTQSNKEAIIKGTVFEIDPENPPLSYECSAKKAFIGLPYFGINIVNNPMRWISLLQRGKRHIVIKEVNPLALMWLIRSFSPRVIFLVRHPAAVAISFHNLGWIQTNKSYDLSSFCRENNSNTKIDEDKNFWSRIGFFQGYVLKMAMLALKGYPDHKVVLYEDLCSSPLVTFHDLFDFADLSWNIKIEKFIKKRTENQTVYPKDLPFSTTRNSKIQIDSWKNKISDENLRKLRDSYMIHNVNLYTLEYW